MTREEAQALLVEYALDALSGRERAEVEAWLSDPQLQVELRDISEGLADFSTALTPIVPSSDARARLMAAAEGPDRYSAVFKDIARFCDLSIDGVRQVLKSIDDAAAWVAGPSPEILIQHFDHGPASVGADTGFVRFPPHFEFPRHRHEGREITIVLDGDLVDHDGQAYGPGDILGYPDGSSHFFRVGSQGLTVVICLTSYTHF
ncbi:MAG: cupin domain-containing protein [Myxococcota bacterium]